MKPHQVHKPNARKKPLRAYGRRRHPIAKAMAKMGLLQAYGWLHPTKGYRADKHYSKSLRHSRFA